MGATGAAGSSGSSGVTGSSATGDRVYRVTLRMDDGSTRILTQDATPDFRSGDRVNLTSGAIAH
jgi:outer membrane lipoprotein SlyB